MDFFESHFKSIDELIKMFDDIEKENINENRENYSTIIDSFNDLIFKFSTLNFGLLENKALTSKKNFYTNGYLTSIINNYLTIRKTFVCGFNFQLQNILRNQFEQLNILISFLYDVDFFNHFTEKKEFTLTPKLKDTEKRIRKIFRNEMNFGNEQMELLNDIFKETYSKLSEATHGNLQRASLHSMEPNGKDSMTFALGGTNSINSETIKIIADLNSYSQTVWLMVKLKMEDNNNLNGSQYKNHLKLSNELFLINYNGDKLDYKELINKK